MDGSKADNATHIHLGMHGSVRAELSTSSCAILRRCSGKTTGSRETGLPGTKTTPRKGQELWGISTLLPSSGRSAEQTLSMNEIAPASISTIGVHFNRLGRFQVREHKTWDSRCACSLSKLNSGAGSSKCMPRIHEEANHSPVLLRPCA